MSIFKKASCFKFLPIVLHHVIITDTGRWFDVLNLIQDTDGFVLADFEVKPYLPCCHWSGVDAGGSADEPGITEDVC